MLLVPVLLMVACEPIPPMNPPCSACTSLPRQRLGAPQDGGASDVISFPDINVSAILDALAASRDR